MIIYLHTSRWRPGQRLAIGGATAALVVAVAWASLGDRGASMRAAPRTAGFDPAAAASEGRTEPFETRTPTRAAAVRAPSTAPAANESSAVPPAPPFQYVGHWKGHGATTVVLSERGRNLLVRVPGAFDDRYHVLAVDEHRLVMKYLPLGIVQTLALSPGAPWTVRNPARPASPTEATAAPVEVPAPEASNRSTSVRMKAGDVESSMEAPGLPVAPTQPLYGATASPVASNDAEPEN